MFERIFFNAVKIKVGTPKNAQIDQWRFFSNVFFVEGTSYNMLNANRLSLKKYDTQRKYKKISFPFFKTFLLVKYKLSNNII